MQGGEGKSGATRRHRGGLPAQGTHVSLIPEAGHSGPAVDKASPTPETLSLRTTFPPPWPTPPRGK